MVEHWSPKPSAEGSSPSAPATSEQALLAPIFCVSTKNQSPASLLLLFPKNPLIFWEPCHETGASVSFFIYLSTSDYSSLRSDFLCFYKKSVARAAAPPFSQKILCFFGSPVMRPMLPYLFSYIYLLRIALRPTPIFCVSTKIIHMFFLPTNTSVLWASIILYREFSPFLFILWINFISQQKCCMPVL